MTKLTPNSIIDVAISRLGYRPIRNGIYERQDSDSEISHRLYFSQAGDKGRFLTADFGLLHQAAQDFGRKMVSLYGGNLYKELARDISKIDCFMRFSLWRFSEIHGPRCWDILSPDINNQIYSDVKDTALSLADTVRSTADFCQLLLKDEEPYPWFAANAAVRAAEVAFLAEESPETPAYIFDKLLMHEKLIKNNLASSVDASDYLRAVISEAMPTDI